MLCGMQRKRQWDFFPPETVRWLADISVAKRQMLFSHSSHNFLLHLVLLPSSLPSRSAINGLRSLPEKGGSVGRAEALKVEVAIMQFSLI